MSLNNYAYRLVSALYARIFKEEMSLHHGRLLASTSFVMVGVLFGALLGFIFTLLGARILGPTDFGNYSLVLTVSTILGLTMGFNVAVIKYAAQAEEHDEIVAIFSTSYFLTLLVAAVSAVIYVLFSRQLSGIFGVPAELYFFSIGYAVFTALFALTTAALRAAFKMKAYAISTAAQSAIYFGTFLVFVALNVRSWQSMVYSVYLADAVIAVVSTVYLKRFISLKFARRWAKKFVEWRLFAAPGTIAGAFMGVDKVLINKFISTAAVGTYTAYFTPSMTVALVLVTAGVAVFFPYASKSNNRYDVLLKMMKAVPYIIIVFVPAMIFLQYAAFIFYGSDYSFSIEVSLLFAVGAMVFLLYQAMSWLMTSEGPSGLRLNSLSSIIALIVLFGSNVLLLPLIGIAGGAASLIVSYTVATAFLITKRRVLSKGAPALASNEPQPTLEETAE